MSVNAVSIPGLRPMIEGDLDQVVVVEYASYPFPWTRGIFKDCLSSGYCCWVMEDTDSLAGELKGYGILSVAAGEAHVLNVAISPKQRQQGLARHLMFHLLDVAKDHNVETVFLEVRPSNTAAFRLYHALGFNQVGQRRDYYPTETGREDALIMALTL